MTFTPIRDLRHIAADWHATRGKTPEYEPGVPYWVHLLIGELHLIAFGHGPRTRRSFWIHDVPEETDVKHHEIRAAGWTSEEVDDAYRCTDEDAPTRAERKVITLPKTALGGYFAVTPKLGDRDANKSYGLLSGSVSMHNKYVHEYPMFRGHLFDRTDARLLPMWYYTDHLHLLRPHKIPAGQFEQRPVRQLVNTWIANKDKLFAMDKVDLLPEWHKYKGLLDAAYGLQFN